MAHKTLKAENSQLVDQAALAGEAGSRASACATALPLCMCCSFMAAPALGAVLPSPFPAGKRSGHQGVHCIEEGTRPSGHGPFACTQATVGAIATAAAACRMRTSPCAVFQHVTRDLYA